MGLEIRAAAGIKAFCRGPVSAASTVVAGFVRHVDAGGGSESIREDSEHVLILSCAVVLRPIWNKTSSHATLENF
ncbi:hypothetical protein ACSSV4_001903 [Roseovarius sp. MBR-154]|jgi:hypothetical protein